MRLHEQIVYNPAKQINQFRLSPPGSQPVGIDRSTLVVFTDGACRDNGRPTARASWGVYFGPNSRYNSSGRLEPPMRVTNSRAEIEAMWQALRIIEGIATGDNDIRFAYIMSDSKYLVDSMNRWMPGWIASGGRRPNGRPVEHWEELKAMDYKAHNLTCADDQLLEVKFWDVPREDNVVADRLANQAF
ncbi:hypothetical protein NKR23_g5014 [Pleurostoma richardsiae]|uniref:ribonuclease H n=1 Tax=Pleurostoma richardsiae TaxID=41990 RepID=A0AA38RQK6_9PEZI|nr:hypothetical protein NKR23_g5014 [Pleurostoma richardsiae]